MRYYIYDSYKKEYVRVSKKCFGFFCVSRFEYVRSFDDNCICFYDRFDRQIGYIEAERGVCIEY